MKTGSKILALLTLLIVTATSLTAYAGGGGVGSWAYKKATSVDDVYNFINGYGNYSNPRAVQSITASEGIFHVFYRTDLPATSGWGWKRAQNEDDAYNFLNRNGSYRGYAKDKALFVYDEDSMYIFYKGIDQNANWGWKRANSVSDMHNFKNGYRTYGEAKEGTIEAIDEDEMIMFYRADKTVNSGWGWKKSNSTKDALNFLNGKGYKGAIDSKIMSTEDNTFYIFYR